jgi:oxalate decarboxylase/phosphoglucose isomerase-like protein (cupin superfamily)
MELQKIKDSIVTNVYNIVEGKKVALHKHYNNDEIFYCIKGE